MSVETDVRNYLLLAPSTSQCSSSFTFIGPMRPAKGGFPVEAVSIQAYGGPNPHGFIDGNSRRTQRRSDVQIRIRGPVNGYAATQARAISIWHYMNRPSTGSISTGSTQYSIVQPFQSDPVYIGENDVEQPEFSFTVRLWSIQGD